MENLLRADPIRGLEIICQNVGLSLRDVAALLGMTTCGEGAAESERDRVTKFAAAHPRFEQLAEHIVFFLETARADDLAEAYDLAECFSSSTASACS